MTIAVIMAGGEGTRLRPFTRSIPKPLLPIGRKPVAQIIVERLRDCGFHEIIMTLEYGADLIRAYFQDGSQFGVKIDYFQEPRKMGTAGCLAHVPGLQSTNTCFLVTNGDLVTDLDYAAFVAAHQTSGAAMSVATRTGSIAVPYGVLHLDGTAEKSRVVSVEEKPTMSYCFNAGIYVLSPETLKYIPTAPDAPPFMMTDLITALATAKKRVRPHPLESLWFDLARVDDFEKALTELEQSHPELL